MNKDTNAKSKAVPLVNLFEEHETIFQQFEEITDIESKRAIMSELHKKEETILKLFGNKKLTVPDAESSASSSDEASQTNGRKRTFDEANLRRTYGGPSIRNHNNEMQLLAECLDQAEDDDDDEEEEEDEENESNEEIIDGEKNESMATEYGFLHYFDLISEAELKQYLSINVGRQRRSTANPQFSSDAIAKKNMKKQAKGAKRKASKTDSQTRPPVAFRNTVPIHSDLSRVDNKKYLKIYCAYCLEQCGDCQKDAIITCKKCRSLFHLICLGDTLKDAMELNIKCRKCHKSSPRNTVSELLNNQRSFQDFKDKAIKANEALNNFLLAKEAELKQIFGNLNKLSTLSDTLSTNVDKHYFYDIQQN